MTRAEAIAIKTFIKTLIQYIPAKNIYDNGEEKLDPFWEKKLTRFLSQLVEKDKEND